MNKLIVGLIIGLLIGGIGGYLISGIVDNSSSNFPNGGFRGSQINESTKQETVSFFENTSDINEISSYCEQNRMNCFYYCAEVNQEHEVCERIMMPNNGGPSRGFGNRG